MMLGNSNNANQTRWLLAGLFAITIALEFNTPQPYVFGYFYTGPILLANARISRAETFGVTVAGIFLTLLNIFLPHEYPIRFATVANRLIAVMALVITSWLSDRTRQYQAEIAQQQAKLQAQAQLSSLREDFVFTLTHDLKTPLLGAIETINSFRQEKFGSVTPTQKKVLATMGRSHQNSLELVETLLDIYRNDTEGLQLQKQEVNLTDLATDAVATFTELAQSRRLHIKLTCGASDFRRHFWVEGDPLQLQRVLANLLANAINYSPRGGKVEIVLDSQSNHHLVKVIDTGRGITPEEAPYLFERFYQGSGDRQFKGSGLGLYLSRQIIAAHGGTIWAENYPGGGAVFGFKLPGCIPNNSSHL